MCVVHLHKYPVSRFLVSVPWLSGCFVLTLSHCGIDVALGKRLAFRLAWVRDPVLLSLARIFSFNFSILVTTSFRPV